MSLLIAPRIRCRPYAAGDSPSAAASPWQRFSPWSGASAKTGSSASAGPPADRLPGLTWCYSAIGMSDDLDSLRPAGRLIGQVILALLFSAIIAMFSTQGIAHVLAFAVIGVTTVNAVNFVDGLNGYVTEWTIVTAGWFAFVGSWVGENDIALLALALAVLL